MHNIPLNQSNLLGQKPIAVPSDILPIYKKAENNDLDAIFDLSRYFFSFDRNTGHLQSALYYKSLLVENYPADFDPYPCAVTMTDIAHIFALLEEPENAKDWFRKTYQYVFGNYPSVERRAVLEEIGFFDSLDTFGIEMKEVILT